MADTEFNLHPPQAAMALDIYLSNTGGATDNLVGMPNYDLLSNKLNNHLANTNNPHALMLSGVRTHQTQITLTGNIVVNNSNYIDSLLVQASNTNNYTITIPNETTIGYTFAAFAAFTAFRLGNATLTVQAAAGVSFVNAIGASIALANPGGGYYLFIRQALNQWAVVMLNSGTALADTLQTAYNNGDGTMALAAAKPFLIKNSSTVPTFNVADSGVTIGNGSAAASAIFDVIATTQGSRPYPSLTTVQRNSIAAPVAGLTVYNVTTNTIDYYNGTSWVSLSQAGFAWSEVTVNTLMTANNGYIANSASTLNLTLPTTAAQGTLLQVSGKGTGGWKILQNAPSQIIRFGDQATTAGNTGSLASTQQWDCLTLLCVQANTVFVVQSSVGNLTVV